MVRSEHTLEHPLERIERMSCSKTAILAIGDGIDRRLAIHRQVRTLWQLLAEQSVGVPTGAMLPRTAVQIAAVHRHDST